MNRFTVDGAGVVEDVEVTATDFLGQTYRVGDLVAYATTSGRSPVLKLGRVHRIEPYESSTYDYELHKRVPSVAYKIGLEWLESARRWSKPAPTTTGKPRLSYPCWENIVRV